MRSSIHASVFFSIPLCVVFLTSCGPSSAPPAAPPATVATSSADHGHDDDDHDHGDHDDGHDHAPATVAEALAALEGHWKAIRTSLAKEGEALADADREAVDSAVHEAGHVLEAVERLADKAEGGISDAFKKAHAELFECLDSFDQKLHGSDVAAEEIRKAFSEVEQKIESAIATLKELASK